MKSLAIDPQYKKSNLLMFAHTLSKLPTDKDGGGFTPLFVRVLTAPSTKLNNIGMQEFKDDWWKTPSETHHGNEK